MKIKEIIIGNIYNLVKRNGDFEKYKCKSKTKDSVELERVSDGFTIYFNEIECNNYLI